MPWPYSAKVALPVRGQPSPQFLAVFLYLKLTPTHTLLITQETSTLSGGFPRKSLPTLPICHQVSPPNLGLAPAHSVTEHTFAT